MQDSQSSLVGQRLNRIEKIKKIRELGINPYPASSNKELLNKEILENYEKFEGKNVTLTGRLMTWREHGHIIFGNLQDDSGKIQLYIKDEVMPKETKDQVLGWNDFELLDIGDILQVSGEITKSNTGEISILVNGITILSKSLRPLPEKWHGIQDKEERFRRRYLDMTMNPEVREMFKRRSKFWSAVREFLKSNGFYEVNIPVLEHTTGGADAKPFVTHFDAIDTDFYLRISHELPLKRLIGGGFEKVFDLGPRFRNEGFSEEHLPEHIAMEFYWAYADRDMGMQFTQEMFRYVVEKVYGKTQFNIRGFVVDLSQEWERIDFGKEMEKRFGIDIYNDPIEKLIEVLKKENPRAEVVENRSRLVDTLWKIHRESIGGPAFIINIPTFFSPLAKADDKNPKIVQRAQPFIAGSEMASSWAELNDPLDQINRFLEQQKMRDAGDDEAQMMDIDYVEMLEYGMPPAFGFGMSERVFWFLENVTAREGVPFPPMRWELDNTTKKIYSDIIEYIDPHKEVARSDKQDLSKKFVTIVNEELEGWKLLNTVGHLTAMLGNTIEKGTVVSRESFETKDGVTLPANSQYPVLAFSASGNQLKTLMDTLKTNKKVKYLIYTMDMIDTGIDDKLEKIYSEKESSDLYICGIGIFGDKEEVGNLTKKFSLYK
jgi:lysyl-tRNA synthetase class 2